MRHSTLSTLGLAFLGMFPFTQTLDAADEGVIISRFNKNTIIVNAPAYDKVPASLINKLEQRVSVNYQDIDLVEAIDQFQKLTRLNVVVDPRLRADAQKTISLNAKNMKASSLVNWFKQLGDIHVSYMNEAIYFSVDKPKGTRKISLLDVSDLTMPIRSFPGPKMSIPSNGGENNDLIAAIEEPEEVDPDDIIDVLKETLEHQGVETD